MRHATRNGSDGPRLEKPTRRSTVGATITLSAQEAAAAGSAGEADMSSELWRRLLQRSTGMVAGPSVWGGEVPSEVSATGAAGNKDGGKPFNAMAAARSKMSGSSAATVAAAKAVAAERAAAIEKSAAQPPRARTPPPAAAARRVGLASSTGESADAAQRPAVSWSAPASPQRPSSSSHHAGPLQPPPQGWAPMQPQQHAGAPTFTPAAPPASAAVLTTQAPAPAPALAPPPADPPPAASPPKRGGKGGSSSGGGGSRAASNPMVPLDSKDLRLVSRLEDPFAHIERRELEAQRMQLEADLLALSAAGNELGGGRAGAGRVSFVTAKAESGDALGVGGGSCGGKDQPVARGRRFRRHRRHRRKSRARSVRWRPRARAPKARVRRWQHPRTVRPATPRHPPPPGRRYPPRRPTHLPPPPPPPPFFASGGDGYGGGSDLPPSVCSRMGGTAPQMGYGGPTSAAVNRDPTRHAPHEARQQRVDESRVRHDYTVVHVSKSAEGSGSGGGARGGKGGTGGGASGVRQAGEATTRVYSASSWAGRQAEARQQAAAAAAAARPSARRRAAAIRGWRLLRKHQRRDDEIGRAASAGATSGGRRMGPRGGDHAWGQGDGGEGAGEGGGQERGGPHGERSRARRSVRASLSVEDTRISSVAP